MTNASLPQSFRKAQKRGQLKAKIALYGASGSGKSYTALKIASMLGKTAVLDTENGSSELYSDEFDFDIMPVSSYTTDTLTNAVKIATDNNYKVLIIDSYSHFWEGQDGLLQVQEAQTAALKNDSRRAWQRIKPLEQAQKIALINSNLHVIVTLRTKNNWEDVVDDRGRTKHKITGVKPIQRENIEYEFSLVAHMTHSAEDVNLAITKSRCSALHGKSCVNPDGQFFIPFFEWLGMKKNPNPSTIPATDIPQDDFNLESESLGVN